MKKLLLSLFVWFVWIISFCSAWVVNFSWHYSWIPGNSKTAFAVPYPVNSIPNNWSVYVSCSFSNMDTLLSSQSMSFTCDRINFNTNSHTTSIITSSDIIANNSVSFQLRGDCISLYMPWQWSNSSNISFDWSCVFSWDDVLSIWWSCPECPTCDDPYTSLECQTEYNLIPVEDVDINYCVWNWLCPNECGSWTDLSWDLQYSNIYINSILHPWEENIFIDIPDYIQWDYLVTTWEFNVYVWSWYDMDYMNSIIKINSYRPTSSDFTNIFVSGLTLIFPYIFVLLLIVFIWKLIKRVFK